MVQCENKEKRAKIAIEYKRIYIEFNAVLHAFNYAFVKAMCNNKSPVIIKNLLF